MLSYLDRGEESANRAGAPQELLRERLGSLQTRRLILRLLGRLRWIQGRPAIVADARLSTLGIALDINPLTTSGAAATATSRRTRLVGIEAGLLGKRLEAGKGRHHALAGQVAGQSAGAQPPSAS